MIPYHTAAERAAHALSQVKMNVLCPCCDNPVACVVNDNDVTSIALCLDTETCYGSYRREHIADQALAIASARRAALAQHYREGGR